MHKNRLWLVFLSCFALLTFGFTVMALYQVRQYWRMSAVAEIGKVSWEIQGFHGELFYPYGHYSFTIGGKEYTGEDFYMEWPSRNASALEEALPQLQGRHWKVWYDPFHPENSALQKSFPFKRCAYAGVLIVLLCYLMGLGFYVGKVQA